MIEMTLNKEITRGDRTVQIILRDGQTLQFTGVGSGQMFNCQKAARAVFGDQIAETRSFPPITCVSKTPVCYGTAVDGGFYCQAHKV